MSGVVAVDHSVAAMLVIGNGLGLLGIGRELSKLLGCEIDGGQLNADRNVEVGGDCLGGGFDSIGIGENEVFGELWGELCGEDSAVG